MIIFSPLKDPLTRLVFRFYLIFLNFFSLEYSQSSTTRASGCTTRSIWGRTTRASWPWAWPCHRCTSCRPGSRPTGRPACATRTARTSYSRNGASKSRPSCFTPTWRPGSSGFGTSGTTRRWPPSRRYVMPTTGAKWRFLFGWNKLLFLFFCNY